MHKNDKEYYKYLSFFLSEANYLSQYEMKHPVLVIFISQPRNILAMALNELDANENVTEAPSDCNTSGGQYNVTRLSTIVEILKILIQNFY